MPLRSCSSWRPTDRFAIGVRGVRAGTRGHRGGQQRPRRGRARRRGVARHRLSRRPGRPAARGASPRAATRCCARSTASRTTSRSTRRFDDPMNAARFPATPAAEAEPRVSSEPRARTLGRQCPRSQRQEARATSFPTSSPPAVAARRPPSVAEFFGYRSIETPVIESTELFSRGVGTDTDIVEKQMFTFEDRGGRSLTLRPEGTAGTLRAVLGAHLDQEVRPVACTTPGRSFGPSGLRQAGSTSSPRSVSSASARAPRRSTRRSSRSPGASSRRSASPGIQLQINSLGSPEDRVRYRAALVAYYTPLEGSLCDDCRRRLHTNPLRLLDCKRDAGLVAGPAPLGLARRREPRALHRRPPRPGGRRASMPSATTGWCAGSTTTATRCSSSGTTSSRERRARSVGEAATTGSPSCSASRPRRRRATPSAWNGFSWSPERSEPFPPTAPRRRARLFRGTRQAEAAGGVARRAARCAGSAPCSTSPSAGSTASCAAPAASARELQSSLARTKSTMDSCRGARPRRPQPADSIPDAPSSRTTVIAHPRRRNS